MFQRENRGKIEGKLKGEGEEEKGRKSGNLTCLTRGSRRVYPSVVLSLSPTKQRDQSLRRITRQRIEASNIEAQDLETSSKLGQAVQLFIALRNTLHYELRGLCGRTGQNPGEKIDCKGRLIWKIRIIYRQCNYQLFAPNTVGIIYESV